MPLFLALALSCTDAPPATVAECDRIGDPTAREDCRLELATPLLKDPPAFDAQVESLDPPTRDLLLVRLAFQQPQHAAWLCQRVETPEGQTRCDRITGRPHLGGTP